MLRRIPLFTTAQGHTLHGDLRINGAVKCEPSCAEDEVKYILNNSLEFPEVVKQRTAKDRLRTSAFHTLKNIQTFHCARRCIFLYVPTHVRI